MKSTYLLINLVSVAFPLAFSLSDRFGFGARWKEAWRAVLVSALPFVAWDIAFARAGVWDFNPDFVLGYSLAGLPAEEILFFLAIPFACLFIYRQFSRSPRFLRPSGTPPGRLAAGLWAALSLALLAVAAAHPEKIYTTTVCVLGAAACAALAVFRPRYSAALVAAVAVQYLPFLIVNGILTSLPIVRYNASEILGLRIGSIPVEDAVYSFILLMLPVALFEAGAVEPVPGAAAA